MKKFPEFTIPELPNIPEMPRPMPINFDIAEISIEEIKKASDEELFRMLNGESNIKGLIPMPTQSAITNELLRRSIQKSTKPHWSIVPSFLLLIIGTVAAIVAAYASLFPAHSQSIAKLLANSINEYTSTKSTNNPSPPTANRNK